MSFEARATELLKNHCLVEKIDTVPRGHVRIQTKLFYPDADSIDLFLIDGGLNPPTLTDFCQTIDWLSTVQVNPWLTKKRQSLLENAIRIFGVRQEKGALE